MRWLRQGIAGIQNSSRRTSKVVGHELALLLHRVAVVVAAAVVVSLTKGGEAGGLFDRSRSWIFRCSVFFFHVTYLMVAYTHSAFLTSDCHLSTSSFWDTLSVNAAESHSLAQLLVVSCALADCVPVSCAVRTLLFF